MSKKKANDDFESQLKSETPVFNGVAITTLKRGDADFLIVKIPIDIKNLVAGDIEVLDTAEHRAEANEKFKINVVKNGVI